MKQIQLFNYKRFLYLTLSWFIVSLIIAIEMKMVGFYDEKLTYSDWSILSYMPAHFLAGVLLIVLVILPFFDLLNLIHPLWLKVFMYILHTIFFGLCYVFIFAFTHWLYGGKNGLSLMNRVFKIIFTDFHSAVRTYFIFMGILIAEDYFKQNINAITISKDLENEVNRVKLQSIKAQLQPHFLFNALNNVVALIDENKLKAQHLLIDLSDLLRYSINIKPSLLVDIDEEIDTLKRYLRIEKAKYENQLIIEWNNELEYFKFKVPPLILQPLVENAIKHGFKNHSGKLTVQIEINSSHILIKNNGQPLKLPLQQNNGLLIVEQRLQLHYNNRCQFSIYQDNGWIINKISIDEAV
ncbi:MAG: histidine kinase [Bacteroidota bacterium]